jgi:nitrite reductase/ring-hydroxylating ferredoxin subunit
MTLFKGLFMQLLCSVSDLDKTQGKGVEVNGKQIMIVRQHDDVFVYENSCPHMGVTLEWQPDQFLSSDNQLIQCATHGAQFVINSGQCIAGPCNGQALKPIDFKIDNGNIYLA